MQHLANDIHRIIQGLINNRLYPGGPSGWFADPAQFTFVFKNAIYSFQTLTGDGVVVSVLQLSVVPDAERCLLDLSLLYGLAVVVGDCFPHHHAVWCSWCAVSPLLFVWV